MNGHERSERFFRAFTILLFFTGLVMAVLGTFLAFAAISPEYTEVGKFMVLSGFVTAIVLVPS